MPQQVEKRKQFEIKLEHHSFENQGGSVILGSSVATAMQSWWHSASYISIALQYDCESSPWIYTLGEAWKKRVYAYIGKSFWASKWLVPNAQKTQNNRRTLASCGGRLCVHQMFPRPTFTNTTDSVILFPFSCYVLKFLACMLWSLVTWFISLCKKMSTNALLHYLLEVLGALDDFTAKRILKWVPDVA